MKRGNKYGSENKYLHDHSPSQKFLRNFHEVNAKQGSHNVTISQNFCIT